METSATSNWSTMCREDRLSGLTRMIADGHSFSEVARAFGAISRNTIIGFANRNGIRSLAAPGGSGRKGKSLIKTPPVPETVEEPVSAKSKKAAAPIVIKPPKAAKPSARLVSAGASLLSRDASFRPLANSRPVAFCDMPTIGRCKWPVDGAEGHGLTVCGATAPDISPWCSTHRRMAFRPRVAKEVSHGKSA